MKLTKADRERITSSVISLQLAASAGMKHNAASAEEATDAVAADAALDPKVRRLVLIALKARAHLHVGHMRSGREHARAFLEPDAGTYWATRPLPERQEMASRQTAAEPHHKRELRAARKLRRAIRALPVAATEAPRCP